MGTIVPSHGDVLHGHANVGGVFAIVENVVENVVRVGLVLFTCIYTIISYHYPKIFELIFSNRSADSWQP